MKEKDKKMMLILFVFIGAVLFVLLLYYFISSQVADNLADVDVDSDGMNFEVENTNIDKRLFGREDFIQLKSNVIFRKNFKNINNTKENNTDDNNNNESNNIEGGTKSNTNNETSNNVNKNTKKEFRASRRNPFKPFYNE